VDDGFVVFKLDNLTVKGGPNPGPRQTASSSDLSQGGVGDEEERGLTARSRWRRGADAKGHTYCLSATMLFNLINLLAPV
jgi:hypothetical protein